MGDRANVCIIDFDSKVFLYTHWSGSELPSVVQRALARKQRWDDGFYLARIIFDEMTKGHQGEETGFGISSVIGDGADRVIVVNIQKQTVKQITSEPSQELSFENFTFREGIAIW